MTARREWRAAAGNTAGCGIGAADTESLLQMLMQRAHSEQRIFAKNKEVSEVLMQENIQCQKRIIAL